VGAARVVLELPPGTTILTPAGWTALHHAANAMQNAPSAASARSIASIGNGDLVVAQLVLPQQLKSALISRDGRSAVIDVLPDMRNGRRSSTDLVRELRALDASTITGIEGSRMIVGGLPAYVIDYAMAAHNALPWIVLVVAASTWFLLAFLLRAPVAATKAVVLNLLVSAASIGAAVLVFQDGFAPVWPGPPVGSILPTVPLLAFGATFGISIDYELFLLAAVRARWQEGADAATAAADGVAAIGGLITRAAAVMMCLFFALAVSSFAPLAMIGFTLGVAVLLDATLVRLVVAPAMMCIAGEWNWWPAVRRAALNFEQRI
jgi:putative drug exporter of the RND superfamily